MSHILSLRVFLRLFLVCWVATTAVRAADIELGFGNYSSGTQPTDAGGMIFTDVANEGTSGINIDLVIKSIAAGDSSYTAANTANNGKVGDNIQVSMAQGVNARFNLFLYDGGTTNLYTGGGSSYEYSLTFYDFDGNFSSGGVPFESFTMFTPGSYTLTNDTNIAVSQTLEYDGFTYNTFAPGSALGGVPNPSASATSLTTQQEHSAVIFSFTDTNTLMFRADFSGSNSGRNFFIDGNTFTSFSEPSTEVPLVPEPAGWVLTAIALVSSATLIRKRSC